MNRFNFIHAVVGKRGSGKTYYTKKNLIDSWMKIRAGRPDERVIVFDTLLHPSYTQWGFTTVKPTEIHRVRRGYARTIVSSWDEVFDQINAGSFKNCMLVFEDCTKYLRKGSLPEEVLKFLADSKQKNLDLVFMYHGFGFVQSDMFRLADYMHILRTGDSPYKKEAYIGEFDDVVKAFEQVKASKEQWPSVPVRIN